MLVKGLKCFLVLWIYPCCFLWTARVALAPLELVLRISLGVGASYGEHHLSIPNSHCVWCLFYWFGEGEVQGRCWVEALTVIKPVAEQICGSRISTPGKSMAAAVAKLLFAGAPTTGMQAAQQSFFFPFYTSATPSASTQRVRLTSRDFADVD